MTELEIRIHFSNGGIYTWTTARPVIDEDGVGFMDARTIRLITGSFAEAGLFVPRDGGGFDSLLPIESVAEAMRLVHAVIKVDRALPRE